MLEMDIYNPFLVNFRTLALISSWAISFSERANVSYIIWRSYRDVTPESVFTKAESAITRGQAGLSKRLTDLELFSPQMLKCEPGCFPSIHCIESVPFSASAGWVVKAKEDESYSVTWSCRRRSECTVFWARKAVPSPQGPSATHSGEHFRR